MPITLNPIGSYRTGIFDDGAAEIVAHDPETQRLFITNGSDKTVDVVDILDPANPTKTGTLEFPPEFAGLAPTSVAVNNGIIAVAVPADPETDPGDVLFFVTQNDAEKSVDFQTSVEVGALPDMVTFSPDGSEVLVANEGQLDDDTGVDPDGSVSIIDVAKVLNNEENPVTTADFTAFNGQEDALRAQGVRIFDGKTVAQDMEPEFIAISSDGATAFVTLQENNAFGVVDITTATVTDILPMGVKDHSVAGNELDASDEDGSINIQNWPVFGMYMSDAIASYEANGQTYYVTANEGDDRGEDVRVNELALDPGAFPNAAELQTDENLGRLNVSSVDGDTDGDGDFDQLFSFGARSFSIWDQSGELVFDSGAQVEQITAAIIPDFFNTDNDENVFDAKSDSQGPEPEGLAVGQVGDQTLAFVGFEDVGGVIVFDITEPDAPVFQSYRNNRDFTVTPGDGDVSDLAPEGLTFIAQKDSPIETPLLVVANELSGSTTLYQVEDVAEPTLSVEITYFTEEAWYANTFGIYNIETGEAEILETNTDLDTNEDLSTGDVLATLEPTQDEFDNLGYFIVANGDRLNDYDSLELEGAIVAENANGDYGIKLDDGSFLNGAGTPAYFSEESKNSDDEDHFDERGSDAETVVLVEDLPGLGDQDFNDLIFTVTATTIEAPLPSMMVGEEGYETEAVLTIGETIEGTTGALNASTAGDYTPVGVLDGIGAYALDADTVRVFASHELNNNRGNEYTVTQGTASPDDDFTLTGARVSYFDINKETREIEDAGLAYNTIIDANGEIATDASFLANDAPGFARFCSSTLIEAEQFGEGRGLEDRIYFTGEEDGGGFNPVGGAEWALDVATGTLYQIPAMGRGAWENITEIDTGMTTHVAFILADDTSPFDADGDGQEEAAPLFLYVGEKDTSDGAGFLARNGLEGGKLFVWAANNPSLKTPLDFRTAGSVAEGQWVEVDNAPQLDMASEVGSTGFDEYGYPTQRNLWTQAEALGTFGFSRPEDVAVNPNDGTEFVLASTGVDTYAVDPDSGDGADTFGTVYTMAVDFSNLDVPTGALNILYDGDEDESRALRSPDNLDWADDGLIYVQEDEAEEDSLTGEPLFGDSAANPNEAGIVRIDPGTGEVTRIANIDRGIVLDASIDNPTDAVDTDAGNAGEWESSGILDVSTLFDEDPGTLFLFDVQAHGIEDQDQFNADSRIVDGDLVEGGQLAFLEVTETDTILP